MTWIVGVDTVDSNMTPADAPTFTARRAWLYAASVAIAIAAMLYAILVESGAL